MDVLLIFLLIFSFTPVLLWMDNWKKTAIGQIPFILGAWFVFGKHVMFGLNSGEEYLWLIVIASLIYGHISFTIILLELRKAVKLHRPYVESLK